LNFYPAYLRFLITVVHNLNKLTLVRMQLPEKYIGRILKFRADALRLELLTPDSGLATGGDWGDETPTTLLQNHLRDMFKSVEKLGGGRGQKTDPIS
jgi:hypothetical protein